MGLSLIEAVGEGDDEGDDEEDGEDEDGEDEEDGDEDDGTVGLEFKSSETGLAWYGSAKN